MIPAYLYSLLVLEVGSMIVAVTGTAVTAAVGLWLMATAWKWAIFKTLEANKATRVFLLYRRLVARSYAAGVDPALMIDRAQEQLERVRHLRRRHQAPINHQPK